MTVSDGEPRPVIHSKLRPQTHSKPRGKLHPPGEMYASAGGLPVVSTTYVTVIVNPLWAHKNWTATDHYTAIR